MGGSRSSSASSSDDCGKGAAEPCSGRRGRGWLGISCAALETIYARLLPHVGGLAANWLSPFARRNCDPTPCTTTSVTLCGTCTLSLARTKQLCVDSSLKALACVCRTMGGWQLMQGVHGEVLLLAAFHHALSIAFQTAI